MIPTVSDYSQHNTITHCLACDITRNQDYPGINFCRHKFIIDRNRYIFSQNLQAKELQLKEGSKWLANQLRNSKISRVHTSLKKK